jgi:hypothetical protein
MGDKTIMNKKMTGIFTVADIGSYDELSETASVSFIVSVNDPFFKELCQGDKIKVQIKKTRE